MITAIEHLGVDPGNAELTRDEPEQTRDLELARMRNRIEYLRGGLKSACGWLYDLDDTEHALLCLEMAGDMEPPLMQSNFEVTGLAPGKDDK